MNNEGDKKTAINNHDELQKSYFGLGYLMENRPTLFLPCGERYDIFGR